MPLGPIEVAHPMLPAAGRLYAGPMPRMPFEDSLGRLSAAGITTIVSLIEAHETRNDLDERYRSAGFSVIRYPIPDYRAPTDEGTFSALLEELSRRLAGGERLYVHCMGGIGRTGTLLACLLKRLGVDGDVVSVVRSIYRGTAVESPEQRRFISSYRGRSRLS